MNIHAKNALTILKTAFKGWWTRDPFKESAVIAFYSIFSLPGLLVVIVTLAGYFFGNEVVSKHVADQINAMLGAETAKQIQIMIVEAGSVRNSVWATIIGIGSIIIGATGVFVQFQSSLNNIWEVKADPGKAGIWKIIKVRLFSFGLIITISFLLIVSLIISAVLSAFGSYLSEFFSDSFLVILKIGNFAVSFIILAILFALMFKFLPDAKIKWKHVWVGAFVTTFLFEIGKTGLGFYFGNANPGFGYGAAGSIILILLWVSYSSILVLYGAEFTHAYAVVYSGKIPPTEIAKSKRT